MNKFFNKDSQGEQWKGEGNSLAYKDHSDFFDKFHELRGMFTESLGKSLFDSSNLKSALSYIYGLIEWTSIYIEKMEGNKMDDIDKKVVEALNLTNKNKSIEARAKVKSLFRDLNDIYEYNDLIPQVKKIAIDEIKAEKDDRTRNGLMAYEILYGK